MKTVKLLFTLCLLLGTKLLSAQNECLGGTCVPFVYVSQDIDPCPLEICIVQTLQCDNQPPEAIRTCSTIEHLHVPPYSQLCYMALTCPGCTLSVTEVTIRRSTTGETITLTGNDAQKFLDLASGTMSGVMILGTFYYNCNGQHISGEVLYLNTQPTGPGSYQPYISTQLLP